MHPPVIVQHGELVRIIRGPAPDQLADQMRFAAHAAAGHDDGVTPPADDTGVDEQAAFRKDRYGLVDLLSEPFHDPLGAPRPHEHFARANDAVGAFSSGAAGIDAVDYEPGIVRTVVTRDDAGRQHGLQ
jgi:hypothetical protein